MDSCGVHSHHDSFIKCKLQIELERPEEVYYGGQYLKGTVKVDLEDAIEITGLKLRLFGGANVRWQDRRNAQMQHYESQQQEDETCSKWHKEEEVYFDDTFVLWGQGLRTSGAAVEQLPSGKHIFPFNWLIPAGVPSSFEGPYGWVRYNAQCMLLAPGCGKGCKTTLVQTKHFTVLRHLDLNSNKIYKEPSKTTKEMSVASHLCSGGHIKLSLLSPRAGYVAGENVLADVDIHNLSGSKIKNTTLTLRQVVKYGLDVEETHIETKELSKAFGDSVKSRKHQCWTCRSIKIPPTVPSGLEKCNIIDVNYEILLTIDRSPQNIYLKIPIYIGTIPPKDSYLTTWTYKENKLPTGSKVKSLIDSTGIRSHLGSASEKALRIDGSIFLPKYRFYHQATPRLKTKNIMPLEASPGRRRRSIFVCRTIRLKSHQWENFESVV